MPSTDTGSLATLKLVFHSKLGSWLPACLALMACREEATPPTSAPDSQLSATQLQHLRPASPTWERPGCALEVTGDQVASWSTRYKPRQAGEPHPTHARSTYWATPEEVLVAKGRNIDFPLELTCAGPPTNGMGGALTVVSRTSTTTHIPMAQGSYPLAADDTTSSWSPGVFGVGVLLVGERLYRPTSGRLMLSRFDLSGIAGSIELHGKSTTEPNRPIHVTGEFIIPCGDVAQSKCQSEARSNSASAATVRTNPEVGDAPRASASAGP